MDVHLRSLRYFIAVAEELHFTRAAQRLFISQPALSRQIARLESDLRIDLLDRDHRTVALTPPGAVLLDHARTLLADWDEARAAIANAAATSAAVLRIGMQTTVARGLFRTLSEHLAETHPTWTLQPTTVDWQDPTCGLANGDVDVAFLWLPLPEPTTYRWVVLSEEARHVAMPHDHHLAGHQTLSIQDLTDEPFIALPESAGPLRSYWLAEEERTTPPVIGGTATSPDETLELVASGHGIVLLSAGNARLYTRDGIATIPLADGAPSQLALAWRDGDTRDVVQSAARMHTRLTEAQEGPATEPA